MSTPALMPPITALTANCPPIPILRLILPALKCWSRAYHQRAIATSFNATTQQCHNRQGQLRSSFGGPASPGHTPASPSSWIPVPTEREKEREREAERAPDPRGSLDLTRTELKSPTGWLSQKAFKLLLPPPKMNTTQCQ